MVHSPVRVRFAPSPTGPLHIGGVRTALFNYLFARQNGGVFILRIEDTDRTRYVEGAEEYILESLKWCGIEIDEGVSAGGPHEPYRQSGRKDIYRRYANRLVESGHAYLAFDTPEQLASVRKASEKEGKTFTYNAAIREKMDNSLNMIPGTIKSRIERGDPYVVRFRVEPGENLEFNDRIRGRITMNTSVLDDKVLFKSDGMPTYHLASVTDDHLMEITHVIRGEEWLPSIPLHVLLYRALGWQDGMPEFAHMPLTLKPDGKGKLSKRDGDRLGFPVFPLEWKNPETGEVSPGYRECGYFPEAFLNILVLLGWNPGTDQELFSMEEMIRAFSLDRVVRAGSRFDPEKARWFNHQYLMAKSTGEVAGLFEEELDKRGIRSDPQIVEKVVGLIRERVDFVHEIWDEGYFFFRPPEEYDQKVTRKIWKTDTPDLLKGIGEVLKGIRQFDKQHIEPAVKDFVKENELGFGKVMNPLRLCLVGSNRGPSLMDIMEVLGREEVLQRINCALDKLDRPEAGA